MFATSLLELKHSIHLHVTLQAGPTPQLAVFLTKLPDMLDDLYSALADKEKQQIVERVDVECMQLAFHIVEALGIWLQRTIDEKQMQARRRGQDFPEHVQRCGDGLLVLIGKTRSIPDKLAAKNAVLRGIAEALRALQTYTKATYPEIRDAKNNLL